MCARFPVNLDDSLGIMYAVSERVAYQAERGHTLELFRTRDLKRALTRARPSLPAFDVDTTSPSAAVGFEASTSSTLRTSCARQASSCGLSFRVSILAEVRIEVATFSAMLHKIVSNRAMSRGCTIQRTRQTTTRADTDCRCHRDPKVYWSCRREHGAKTLFVRVGKEGRACT